MLHAPVKTVYALKDFSLIPARMHLNPHGGGGARILQPSIQPKSCLYRESLQRGDKWRLPNMRDDFAK